jgi:tape measure domain-containing protein
MSVDISRLGIEVKSTGIKEASQGLSGLGTSAANAERRVQKLTDTIDKLIGSMTNLAKLQGTATQAAAAHIQMIQGGTAAMQGMQSSAHATTKTLQQLQQQATQTGNAFGHAHHKGNILNNTLKSMMVAMSAYVGINFIKGIVEAGDAWQMMTAKLNISTGSMSNAVIMQERLFKLAQEIRVPLEEVGKLYNRMAVPMAELGKTSGETIEMVKGVALALQLGGSTAAEASSAILQFSQAINAGRLNGAEFNAVSEAAPLLIRAIRDELEKTEKKALTLGAVKKLGSDGKISVEIMQRAISKAVPEWEKLFNDLPVTVGSAVTRVKNAWLKAMGEMSQQSGLNKGLVEALGTIESIIPAIRDEMVGAVVGVGKWIKENRDALADSWTQVKGLVGDMVDLASKLSYAAGAAAGMGNELSAFGFTLYSVRLFVAGIQDGFVAIGSVVLKLGQLISNVLIGPINLLITTMLGVLSEHIGFIMRGIGKSFSAIGLDTLGTNIKNAGDSMKQLSLTFQEAKGAGFDLAAVMGSVADNSFNMLANGEGAVQRVLKGEQQISAEMVKQGKYQEGLTKTRKASAELDEKAAKALEKIVKAANSELDKSIDAYREQAVSLEALRKFGLDGDKRTKAQKEQITLERALAEATNSKVKAILQDAIATNRATQEMEKHEKVIKDALTRQKENEEQVQKSIESAIDEAQKNEDLVRTFGMAKGALEELELARVSEQLARAKSLADNDHEIEQLQKLYDALQRNTTARKQLGVLEEQQKTFEAAQREWEKTVEKIDDVFREGFADMLNHGVSSWKSFTKSLATTFKTIVADAIYKTFIRKYVVNIVGNFVGKMGGGIGVMGGSPDLMGLFNTGSTLWNAGSTVAGWLGLGGATSMGVAGATGITASAASTGLGFTAGGGMGLSAGAGGATGITAGSAGASSIGSGLVSAGQSGAAAGSSIGSALSAAGPYLAAAAIGYAVWKSLDDSGTIHSGGAARANALGSQTMDARSLGFMKINTTKEAETAASSIASGIVNILNSTATTFGKEAGYSAATAFADDTSKDGAWGALVIENMGKVLVDWDANRQSRWAPREFNDGEAGRNEYLAELSKSVRSALDTIGLPSWAQQMLDSLGEAPSIQELGSVVEKINAAQNALVAIGSTIKNFAQLTDAATSAIINASGGIDAFTANINAFYDGYYSESEKIENVSKQVSSALVAVGLEMPTTRKEFRQLVEAQLALGESGATAVATLLKVSGAFGQVADYTASSAEEVISKARELSRQRSDLEIEIMELTGDTAKALAARRAIELAGMEESLRPLQERIYLLQDEAQVAEAKRQKDAQVAEDRKKIELEVAEAINQARSKLSEAYERESSALQATIDKFKDFSKSLRTFRDSLLVGNLSNLSPEAKYLELRNRFEKTASLAASGNEEALTSLQSISEQFLEASKGYFASSMGYTQDFERVRAALEQASLASDVQVDIGTQQLSALQASVQELIDINQSVLSVKDAILALKSLTPEKVITGGPGAGKVVNGVYTDALGNTALSKNLPTNRDLVKMWYSSHPYITESPTEDAIDYWTNQLSRRDVSQYDVKKTFADSAAYVTGTNPVDIKAFANGGNAEGWSWVGEQGKELAYFGDKAHIYTARESQQIVGGSDEESKQLLRDVLVELQAANAQRGAATEAQLISQRTLAEKLDAQRRVMAAASAE